MGPASSLRTTLTQASRCGVEAVGPTVTTREVRLSAVESRFSWDAEEGLRRGPGWAPSCAEARAESMQGADSGAACRE